MRTLFKSFMVACLLPVVAWSADGVIQPNRPQLAESFLGYVPDRFIVEMKPEAGQMTAQSVQADEIVRVGIPSFDAISEAFKVSDIKRQFAGATTRPGRPGYELSRFHKITIKAGTLDEAMQAYRDNPLVERVEPIGIHAMYATPNDTFFSPYQWYHNQASDHDIDSPEAWDIQTGSDALVVAILDSGTRYYHPDLGGANGSPSNPGASRGNMWINTPELNGTTGVDDDGNGYTDDWIGYDFIQSTTNCWPGEDCNTKDNDPRDFNGHGTHTSGIVGMMTNDGYGMAGVAGGWGNGSQQVTGNGVKIMPLRMGYSYNYLGQEYGVVLMDAAAEAFYYAADNGAKIASCSWGSSNSGGLGAAVTYFLNSGGIVCVAAGNDANQVQDYLNGRGDCISVAATNENDNAASFTSYGTWVDISAPGNNIYSTYHDHTDPNTNYWASLSGTSMATPMTAGVVALIWSQNPSWTAAQVTNQLYSSADNIDAYLSAQYIGKMGAGRINAYNAVNTGPPPAPVAEFSGLPTSGTEPLTVDFTDLSTGSITSWDWTFGDGGTSTAQNPSYEYMSAGTYTVSLTVTGPGGSDGETKVNYITVNPCLSPTAEFSGSPLSGTEPLTVDFTDLSTGGATSWSWTFGDGGTSTSQDPTHQYASAGTYTVSLTSSNACGSDVETKVDYITVDPFSGYCDDFNDGDVSDWNIQNGTWTPSGGQYDGFVSSGYGRTLAPVADMADGSISVDWTSLSGGTWTNGQIIFAWQDASNYRAIDMRGGSNNWFIREYIGGTQYNRAQVNENINTNQQYALEVTVDPSGLVTLYVNGLPTASYNFGNVVTGPVGLGVNQSHSVYDNFCVTSTVVPPPVAEFSGTPTSGDAPLTVDFTDLSTGSVSSWDWTFGDGGTSTAQNPSYEYISAGVYTVSLTVTGPGGSDGETKVDYITVSNPPVATVIGEVGEVVRNQTGAGADWYTVNLNNSYADPVVVMRGLTTNGGHKTHLRVRNVSSGSFEWQQEEWDYLDGNHTTEDCPYFVLEAGSHTLEDGTLIEAGTASIGTGFTTINFSQSFSATPTLITGVASDNDDAAVITRTRNLGTGSFQIRIQEEEAADGVHANETIAWVAIEQGSGMNNGEVFETARTPNAVTDAWYTINFATNVGANAIFMCHDDTYDGSNTCGTRYRNLGATSVEAFIEEEQSLDEEVGHVDEVVSYVVWGAAGDILSSGGSARVASQDRSAAPPLTVASASAVPGEFRLDQNFPNPFNAGTVIPFSLDEGGHVTVTVYDVLGREVRQLAARYFTAGRHQIPFDGTTDEGRPVSSGMYFYRIQTQTHTAARKMLILK